MQVELAETWLAGLGSTFPRLRVLKLRYFDIAVTILTYFALKGRNIVAQGKRSGDCREVPPWVT